MLPSSHDRTLYVVHTPSCAFDCDALFVCYVLTEPAILLCPEKQRNPTKPENFDPQPAYKQYESGPKGDCILFSYR